MKFLSAHGKLSEVVQPYTRARLQELLVSHREELPILSFQKSGKISHLAVLTLDDDQSWPAYFENRAKTEIRTFFGNQLALLGIDDVMGIEAPPEELRGRCCTGAVVLGWRSRIRKI